MGQKKLKMLEQQLMVYRVIIEDKDRIRATNELLNSFLTMFLEWTGMSKLAPGKMDIERPGILTVVPSYYLTNSVDLHQIYMNFENSLTNNTPPSYVASNFTSVLQLQQAHRTQYHPESLL
jgi:hypothetical protein